MKILDIQLKKMQDIRVGLGISANPFTRKDIEEIFNKIKKEGHPFVRTGCFKFYFSDSKKSLVAELDAPIKFLFANVGEGVA